MQLSFLEDVIISSLLILSPASCSSLSLSSSTSSFSSSSSSSFSLLPFAFSQKEKALSQNALRKAKRRQKKEETKEIKAGDRSSKDLIIFIRKINLHRECEDFQSDYFRMCNWSRMHILTVFKDKFIICLL